MSIFKRISTTLYSQLDEMVGEIENHDALIKAAITEQKKKLASAKVQLGRIQANETKVGKQIDELKANEQRWAERAVKAAEHDEQQALSCLHRRQQVQTQIKQLKDARQAYQQTASRMSTDIAQCEQELKSMHQKHELMQARQSSVEARNIFSETGGTSLDDLEASFNRWEVKLAQGEINLDNFEPIDQLEATYIEQENEDELRQELEKLMNKQQGEAS